MKRKFTFLIAAALMLLTMMATTGEMWGQTWEKATSIQVGDVVVLVTENSNNSTTKMELTGFSSTSTVYGIGTAYTSTPACTYTFEVVAGKTDGTFAFKHGSSYLYWASGNSLNVNSTLSANTSWTVSINGTTSKATIKNAADNTRQIWWNVSSPRFACYTDKTEGKSYYITTLYKQVTSGDTPSITANNVDIAYNATEGSIGYTLHNATGNVNAEVTNGDWLTLGVITENAVPFTCSANEGNERTATVTLSFTGASNKVVTITQAGNPDAPGTQNNPYTVAEAIAATPTSGTSSNVYIHGIVSAFYNTSIVGDGSNYRYYISDDGTTTSQLLVYKGKGLNNEAFSKADDLLIGDEIILFGGLTMYQNAPEVAANNYIVSLERPVQDVATPTFSVAAGTYASAQEVEISCETDGATIYYTLDGTEPTEASTPYNGALNIETTTTVKAIAYKNTANSYVATATYHICSAETPYTVAQALAFNEYPTSTIWVHGIVSTAPTTAPSSGQLKYYISDNDEATNELYIYNGKGLNNAAFTAQDDIQVGDIVTITGIVKDYQGTLEFDSGNYLTSFERPTVATPTFTPEEGEYTEAQSVTIACATEGAAIYYTLDGTEPTNASTLYEEEISVVSTTTIKAIGVKAGLANSEIATATYTITIAPTASIEIEPASLSVDADAHEETFTVAYVSVDADLAEIRTCDEGGNDVSYDWFSATFASTTDHNNITCTIAANDGDARTAYFLVHVSGNVFSDIIAVSQEAYVVPPTPVTEGWVLTDLADLAEGDVFVIVGDNGSTYAMSNDNGTSSAPAAVEVTVSNYALPEEPAENLKWNLTIADGTYTFYPNGDTEKWLYCTNTNNGVRVGTNGNKTFTISNGYLFNSGTSRYVGIYNSQDWRCYTSITGSSNIKDQTFAFYKKVTGAYVAAPTFTPVGGVYTEAQTVTITCTTEGASIFYKTTENGEWIAYTAAINIAQTTTIWAKAVKEEAESTVATATYTINLPEPSITVTPDAVNATAEGGNANLTVTCANMGDSPELAVQFYTATSTPTTCDWINTAFYAGNLVLTVQANASDARTAYFKVYALDDNAEDVYSNLVTINQAAYIAPSQEVTDVLNNSFTGVTGTTYSAWTNTGTSGAVYAGNSAGGNDAIQLRSNNSNSGIVTTTSGGKVTKVEVTWNGNTSSGRIINIYGKNTAYEAASDLYGDNQGTKLGTIEYDNNTALIITDDYEFIGIRSNSGALYLDEIQITWSTTPAGPSITVTPAEITDVSAAGDIPEHTVILANLNISSTDDFLFAYCDLEGNILGNTDPKPNWIELAEAEYTATGENVYSMVYTVAANEETTPRTGYFKIGIEQATETVYSNIVTVTQLGYVTPVATITVVPNEVLDVPAAGDVYVHTVTLENMTVESTDDFTLAFCDENGDVLDEQAPKPDWIEIGDVEFAVTSEENVYSLTYPVAENTETTPRTAYFKVAATQTSEAVYSNLVTVTQAGYVPPVVADNYELFSGNLEEGDYIIYYNGYALKNEELNTTGRLSYEVVTPENDVISTADATIVWHIAPSSEYWTIYSADADAYAASTGAKNKAQMLADGTDDKAMWTVSGDETYEFINKANSAANVNCNLGDFYKLNI